jgi:hypothetical protein
MRPKPTLLDDALVALLASAVVLGHVMYFMAEGLPSLLWRS